MEVGVRKAEMCEEAKWSMRLRYLFGKVGAIFFFFFFFPFNCSFFLENESEKMEAGGGGSVHLVIEPL